jgi:hypothetical protein
MLNLIVYAHHSFTDQDLFEETLDAYHKNITILFVDNKCQADAFMLTYSWNRMRHYEYLPLTAGVPQNVRECIIFMDKYVTDDLVLARLVELYGEHKCRLVCNE